MTRVQARQVRKGDMLYASTGKTPVTVKHVTRVRNQKGRVASVRLLLDGGELARFPATMPVEVHRHLYRADLCGQCVCAALHPSIVVTRAAIRQGERARLTRGESHRAAA